MSSKKIIKQAPDVKKPLPKIKEEMMSQALAKNGMNQTKSYNEVYQPKSDKYSAQNSSDLLTRKPYIKDRVKAILDETEATSLQSLLSVKLPQLLNQSKILVTKDGNIDVPDAPIQMEALKVGLKLHRVLEDDRPDASSVIVTSIDADQMSKLIARLEDMNKALMISPIQRGKVIDV